MWAAKTGCWRSFPAKRSSGWSAQYRQKQTSFDLLTKLLAARENRERTLLGFKRNPYVLLGLNLSGVSTFNKTKTYRSV